MKNLVYKIYKFYYKYIPFKFGKFFISRILTNFFGTFIIKTKSDIFLEVFLTSSQDQYYFNSYNNDICYNEILNLKNGDIYVDIDANIGFYSIIACYY